MAFNMYDLREVLKLLIFDISLSHVMEGRISHNTTEAH